MTYEERMKEFGILSSMGMSKKQRKNLLIKESIILATVSLIIGIILGIGISFFAIKFLDILASKAGEYASGAKFLIDPSIKFYMVISFKAILLTASVIYIVAIISSILPMRKINKISPIDAIRNTNTNKINAKDFKIPKIVKKLFEQEGELAYRNIRKDKSKNKTIVISIVISMILFLSLSNLLNIYLRTFSEDRKISKEHQIYTMHLYLGENKNEKLRIVDKYLKENEVVNSYIYRKDLISYSPLRYMLVTKKENMTEEIKKLSETSSSFGYFEKNEEALCLAYISVLSGKEYEELLDILGIEELQRGECILSDCRTGKTKYGDDIRITKYEKGDKITIKELDEVKLYRESRTEEENEEARKQEEELMNKIASSVGSVLRQDTTASNSKPEAQENEYSLKIAEVINKEVLENTLVFKNMLYSGVQIIVSEETINEWEKDLGESIDIYVDTNDSDRIDADIDNINVEENAGISGMNYYKDQTQRNQQGLIKKVVIYGFIVLISLFSALNIFITIISSINLRKREFAVLKSIGMDNKKINKMLFLEGIFYGLNALIYGLLIGCTILYIIYRWKIDTNLYEFHLPWLDIIICIVIAYAVIFMAIYTAKSKIRNENIVEDIRNENL